MKPTQIVILGGGYAGVSAALRIHKLKLNCSVTLVNESEWFVERIRNHEWSSGKIPKKIQMTSLLPKSTKFIEARATKIDPYNNSLELHGKDGKENLKYDYLIYALGSTTVQKIHESVYSVSTAQESERLRKAVKNQPRAKVWVLGGGLTGIEIATELKETHPDLKVGLIDKKELGHGFSNAAKKYLRHVFTKMDIDVVEITLVSKIQEGKILLENTLSLSSDIAVQAFGFQCSPLGKDAGLPTNSKNQIIVDERLRPKGFSNIICAGDSVSRPNTSLRMGCATAMPMGTYAAEQLHQILKGKSVDAFCFSFVARCVSLGRRNGMIQFVDENDRATDKVWTNKLGALTKELVCKGTTLVFRLEKQFPFRIYTWPGRRKESRKNQKRIFPKPQTQEITARLHPS